MVGVGKGKEWGYVVKEGVGWGEKGEKVDLWLLCGRVIGDGEDEDGLDGGEVGGLGGLYGWEEELGRGGGEEGGREGRIGGMEGELGERRGGEEVEGRGEEGLGGVEKD